MINRYRVIYNELDCFYVLQERLICYRNIDFSRVIKFSGFLICLIGFSIWQSIYWLLIFTSLFTTLFIYGSVRYLFSWCDVRYFADSTEIKEFVNEYHKLKTSSNRPH